MRGDFIFAGIFSVFLLIYLTYSILYPEKF
ncbi:MAG: K(+)-transporting ATPase subunit F [Rhabdochlamydiaceae bacterium]|nr:K(+)-transporting ATPase subunit F [Rhabdochlamydiaceae bacterium]